MVYSNLTMVKEKVNLKKNEINKSTEKLANAKGTKKQLLVNKLRECILSSETYNVISIIVVVIAVGLLLVIGFDECQKCFKNSKRPNQPIHPPKERKSFFAYGRNIESGYLKNVFLVLDRLGYKYDPNETEWDLLWAHDYPFRTLYPKLKNLKPHQKVNHFPGCGYITNKVDLAVSGLKYIPPAFKLPKDKTKLLEYSKNNPSVQFVQKNNDHRHIKIKKLDEIDMNVEDSFIQVFVDKPLLVSGYKFDIGIYTVITSIDPLRIYIYNGDALLRFCPVKYYPFDPENVDKYVVGDDYLPTWNVPDLKYYYQDLGFGMKESLNAYLRSNEQDPTVIWNQIEDAIRIVILAKEPQILDVVNRFPSKRNFFEMMRFDFVVDENLKVYLMEANMSPNLSSAHFPPNQLLFEQVIFNLLGLVGIGERIDRESLAIRSEGEEHMQSADKNIAVYPKECHSPLCRNSCVSPLCQLCKTCLTLETKESLLQAHKEHLNRGDCKRIFPPVMTKESAQNNINFEDFSAENQLHYRWFQGKCLLDDVWCN